MTTYSYEISIYEYGCNFIRCLSIFGKIIFGYKPITNKIPMHISKSLEKQPQIRWILQLQHSQQEHHLTVMHDLINLRIPVENHQYKTYN